MTLPIKSKSLLQTALTHRSYLNESKSATEHNERLEYLGDAVLELAVSEFLYHKFSRKPEGELTALRSALVKTTTLAIVAQKLNLGQQLRMSKGEERTGGRHNTSLLANTVEAVIGAIYLDSDFATVKSFLDQHLYPLLPNIIKNNLHKDYKSVFQEKVQAQGQPTPTYQLVSSSGPDHNKIFTMAVLIKAKTIATGSGASKQQAEQRAAHQALNKLAQGLAL